MKFYLGLFLAAALLPLSSANAVNRVLTFDTAPTFELPQEGLVTPLQAGEWGTEEDGIDNNVANDPGGATPVPIWNPGGWIQPIGTETATNHRVAIGPNPIGVDENAILAELGTGVAVYDNTNWGDVSTATHVTMDVTGSFAGSGGITVLVAHNGDVTPIASTDSDLYWSWASAASAVSVGLNPGDVTEFTTIQIPINKPQPDGGAPNGENGTWGTFGLTFFDTEWDALLADVNFIQVVGLTPDTQIDNLGFVLPDLPGDFDLDADVDGGDFLEWQRDRTGKNLSDWESNFGAPSAVEGVSAIPEPTTAWLLLAGCGLLGGSLRGPRKAVSAA